MKTILKIRFNWFHASMGSFTKRGIVYKNHNIARRACYFWFAPYLRGKPKEKSTLRPLRLERSGR